MALWPENRAAWQLWEHVQTQWRTAPWGLLGLDYTALRSEAAALGIALTPALMNKIKALELREAARFNAEVYSP